MSKVYGLNGYIRGKMGNTVFAIRNGEQLARQYNPNPQNPKSAEQTANRARLKLLSQLSACYAPIIAIKRKGNVTARNLFLKRNYEYADFVDGQAEITLADVQLTNSAVSLAGFEIDRTGTDMTLELTEDMGNNIDRVVYVVVKKTGGQELIVAGSKVVEFAEGRGTFPTTMPKVTGEIVVMAYGIRLNTEAARVTFGNLTAPTAQEIARLLVTMNNAETALTLTVTRGLQLAADENEGETTGIRRVTISPFVSSASAGTGTVAGGGRVDAGSEVTVTATATEGSSFVGWFTVDGSTSAGNRVSTRANYTFMAGEVSQNLYAVFGNGQE